MVAKFFVVALFLFVGGDNARGTERSPCDDVDWTEAFEAAQQNVLDKLGIASNELRLDASDDRTKKVYVRDKYVAYIKIDTYDVNGVPTLQLIVKVKEKYRDKGINRMLFFFALLQNPKAVRINSHLAWLNGEEFLSKAKKKDVELATEIDSLLNNIPNNEVSAIKDLRSRALAAFFETPVGKTRTRARFEKVTEILFNFLGEELEFEKVHVEVFVNVELGERPSVDEVKVYVKDPYNENIYEFSKDGKTPQVTDQKLIKRLIKQIGNTSL